MRYRPSELSIGKGAMSGPGKLWLDRLFDTEKEALVACLQKEGHLLIKRLDKIQKKLEALDAINPNDPYGWRA